jgi:hypothetical protein
VSCSQSPNSGTSQSWEAILTAGSAVLVSTPLLKNGHFGRSRIPDPVMPIAPQAIRPEAVTGKGWPITGVSEYSSHGRTSVPVQFPVLLNPTLAERLTRYLRGIRQRCAFRADESTVLKAALPSQCFPLKRPEPFAAHRFSPSRNVFSLCDRDGWRSLRKALASI